MIVNRKTSIGLDINDTSICVVELRAAPKGLRLVRSGSTPTPPGSVLDGKIVEPRTVAGSLTKLLQSVHLNAKGKRVFVSLPVSAVVTRVTQLPVGAPHAIQEQLQQEIKRYAPFTGEATVSDFAVINPSSKGGETRPTVLAVTKKDTADALAETIIRAGMEPVAIDVSFLASARALYSQHLTRQPPAAVVLVVIETKSVHLVVVRGGTIPFSRTTPHPCDILYQATGSLQTLVSEIRSVLDFYATQIGELQEVQKVIISVDHDVPETIKADLSRALETLPVVISSPSSIIEDAGLLEDGTRGRPTACAIGLAMRGIGQAAFPVNLNLLPQDTVRLQMLKKRALVTAILAASMFLFSLLGMGAVRLRLHTLDQNIEHVQQRLTPLGQSTSGERLRSGIARLSAELEMRDAHLRSAGPPVHWSELLSEIAKRTPKDVRLTSMKTGRADKLTLKGEALSVGSISRFARLLADSDLIRSAKLVNVERLEQDESKMPKYRIDCQLGTPSENER